MYWIFPFSIGRQLFLDNLDHSLWDILIVHFLLKWWDSFYQSGSCRESWIMQLYIFVHQSRRKMCWLTTVYIKSCFLAPLFSTYSNFHIAMNFRRKTHKAVELSSSHQMGVRSCLRSGSCFSLMVVWNCWQPGKKYPQFIQSQCEATAKTSFVTWKLSLLIFWASFSLLDRESLQPHSTVHCTS